jgi:hypothetical protein
VSNRRVDEVPNFDAFIATASYQMAACWMEVNGAYPVFVALSCHDVFLVFKVPDLPAAVISGRRYDLLLSMEGHTSNSPWLTLTMSFNFFFHGHALHDVLKSLRQVWVGTSIVRPWCVLALKRGILLDSTTHPLLLHTGINLLLDFLFVFINSILKIIHFLL